MEAKIKFARQRAMHASDTTSKCFQLETMINIILVAALRCARNRSPTLVKLYGASAAYLAILWLGIPLSSMLTML